MDGGREKERLKRGGMEGRVWGRNMAKRKEIVVRSKVGRRNGGKREKKGRKNEGKRLGGGTW